jgi:hypothetical protein
MANKVLMKMLERELDREAALRGVSFRDFFAIFADCVEAAIGVSCHNDANRAEQQWLKDRWCKPVSVEGLRELTDEVLLKAIRFAQPAATKSGGQPKKSSQ